jgi:ParB-like chromosome segregation protein Spo0J
VLAARKLGMSEVPCIRLDHLTEAQKRAYVIADNRLALNSGWDTEMLKVEFADLQELGFDLELTGFDRLLGCPEVTIRFFHRSKQASYFSE